MAQDSRHSKNGGGRDKPPSAMKKKMKLRPKSKPKK